MPVSIRKTKGGRYKVFTPQGVKSKSTTLQKALRQRRFLNALENNPNFTPQ